MKLRGKCCLRRQERSWFANFPEDSFELNMKLDSKAATGLVGLLALCGCLHLPEARVARPPAPPLSGEIAAWLAKPDSAASVAAEREGGTNSHYRVVRIELRSSSGIARVAKPAPPVARRELGAGSDPPEPEGL